MKDSWANLLVLRFSSIGDIIQTTSVLNTLKKWVPITFEAFMDYRVGGTEVSSKGKKVLKDLISGKNVNIESSDLSKREWNELMNAFGLDKKIVK